MDQQDIKQIILDHPEMSYAELKKQAVAGGIHLDDFNAAWEAYVKAGEKKAKHTVSDYVYLSALFIIALLIFDYSYWGVFLVFGSPASKIWAGFIGLISALILIMHGASRMMGSGAKVSQSTVQALLLSIMAYLVHLATAINNQAVYIFAVLGGAAAIIITFVSISRNYQLDLGRSILFFLMTLGMLSVVIQFTYGLIKFKEDFYELQPIEQPAEFVPDDRVEDVFKR